MGLSVIPTNIGGVNIPLAQLQGPLSKLFQDQSTQNLVFPADLATNPAMGHAVMFSVFDYKSGFTEETGKLADLGGQVAGVVKGVYDNQTKAGVLNAVNQLNQIGESAVPSVAKLTQAKTYERQTKNNLANISLFMPDTLVAQHDPSYQEVNMTDVLGLKGYLGNAYQDFVNNGGVNAVKDNPNTLLQNEYAKNLLAKGFDVANKGTLGTGDLGAVAQQAMGQFTNPQTQLLFKGLNLRTFTLEFLFTPKSAQEAQTVKDIVDTFTFYSLPGLAGGADGKPGQYLTPPQLFQIKFKFLSGNGILDQVYGAFKSAMSNIGLGFLTSQNPTNTITNAPEAKIMTINECVLDNMSVDYAPTGVWSAYNDGYGVQTRMTLTFKEMSIMTKNDVKNKKIKDNMVNQQTAQNAGFKNAAALATFDANNPGLNEY